MKAFLDAWDALPVGNFEGIYQGRRYGVTRTERDGGRQAWLWAEERGGTDTVSANLYRLRSGARLKPCEMAEAKVVAFVLGVIPIFELMDFPSGSRYHGPMVRALIFILFVLALPASSALAQTGEDEGKEKKGTTINLGAAFGYFPEYVGSADSEFRVLPYIAFDDIAGFELNGLSLSYPLFETGTGRGPGKWSFRAGPRAGFDFGRDSEDSPTLTGLEDIDTSLLIGGFARFSYGPVGFGIDAGQDVLDGHEGFNADLSIGTFIPRGILADRLALQPSLTLSWADGTHNQTIYGVTPQQAAVSSLPAYELDGGFHRASANLLGFYDLSERWSLTSVISYREYLGDYRDSPILRAPDGSTSDLFVLVGLARSFTF